MSAGVTMSARAEMNVSVKYSELNKIGTLQCRKWASRIFKKHRWIDGYLKTTYIRKARDKGYVQANKLLFSLDKKLTLKKPELEKQADMLSGFCDFMESNGALNGTFSAAMDDDELTNIARARAIKCEDIFTQSAKLTDIVGATKSLIMFCESLGIKAPISIRATDNYEAIAIKSMACKERLCDTKWWERQIRKHSSRQVESVLRTMGAVRKGASSYVSNYSFNRWKARQSKNKKLMREMEVVNEQGERVTLEECVKKSVSNPALMRAELMTRMRGYEEAAEYLALGGVFLTLTCPSKYHPQRSKGGKNPRFSYDLPEGEFYTVADAMACLNKMWSLIRGRWQKAGIRVFGFRVAEPHHDGTPHLHFLLFVEPGDRQRAVDIFKEVALLDRFDGGEKGASEKRCDCVVISPEKGTAAAYIAKYVAKNMDGYAVGWDLEAECAAEEGAARVKAWASLNGIRQFQQIGSVSVTVWRELRRKREAFADQPCDVEALRKAASEKPGDWREFVELMGGPFVRRDQQTLRPEYFEDEKLTDRYGGPVKKIIGLKMQPCITKIRKMCGAEEWRVYERVIPTREHVWKIQLRNYKKESHAPPVKVDLMKVISDRVVKLNKGFLYARDEDGERRTWQDLQDIKKAAA